MASPEATANVKGQVSAVLAQNPDLSHLLASAVDVAEAAAQAVTKAATEAIDPWVLEAIHRYGPDVHKWVAAEALAKVAVWAGELAK